MLKRSLFIVLFFLVTSHCARAMEKPVPLNNSTSRTAAILSWFPFGSWGSDQETLKKVETQSTHLPRVPSTSLRDALAMQGQSDGDDKQPARLVLSDEASDDNEQELSAQQTALEYQRKVCARLYYEHCGGRPVTPPGESTSEPSQRTVLKASLEFFPGGGCCK